MLNKEDNLFKLCIFVAITIFLASAMSILLVQGYDKKEAGLEFSIKDIYFDSYNSNGSYKGIKIRYQIENTGKSDYYPSTRTINLVIRDSKNHIFYSTNFDIDIEFILNGATTETHYVTITTYVDNVKEINNETFSAEFKFVEPKLYSIGYALIPFIIVFGYGVIVCLINIFKNKKEQVSNTNEEEKSNNLEENTLSINEQDKEQNVSNTNETEKEKFDKENKEQS